MAPRPARPQLPCPQQIPATDAGIKSTPIVRKVSFEIVSCNMRPSRRGRSVSSSPNRSRRPTSLRAERSGARHPEASGSTGLAPRPARTKLPCPQQIPATGAGMTSTPMVRKVGFEIVSCNMRPSRRSRSKGHHPRTDPGDRRRDDIDSYGS
jgi:hypothetical protein